MKRSFSGDFATLIERSPIIPALRSPDHLTAAVAAPSAVAYVLCGNVLTVGDLIGALRAAGKVAVVNLDLLGGLDGDPSAVAFLARLGAGGIISTRPETLRATRSLELYAVQRSFLLDSHSVASGLRALDRFEPDAVELLPAPAAPRVAERFSRAHPNVVLTAGGLVSSLLEIDALVRDGMRAVSVSDPALWIA